MILAGIGCASAMPHPKEVRPAPLQAVVPHVRHRLANDRGASSAVRGWPSARGEEQPGAPPASRKEPNESLRPSLPPRNSAQRQALPRQDPGRCAFTGRRRLRVQSRLRTRMPQTRPLRDPSPRTQRPCRAHQRRLALRVLRNMGPPTTTSTTWAFADDFNVFRPRRALDGQTPAECPLKVKKAPTFHRH